jgi:hypothetical protein
MPGRQSSNASLWPLKNCIVVVVNRGALNEHLSGIFVRDDGGMDAKPFAVGPAPFENS